MNIKKFFVSMLVTFLVVLVVGGGLMTAQFMFGTNLSSEITKFLDKSKGDKVNILLMGLDQDKIRADVVMVVSLDPEMEQINVLSLPRDTRVQYSTNRYDKLNHAMGYKNPEETIIRLVKQVTGMPIHYYCEVDFKGVKNIVDILGGVDFEVPCNMNYDDPVQNLHIHLKKGMQHLDGQKAHDMLRFRHNNDMTASGLYALGDEGRIDTTQKFLKALFEQKLKPEYLMKAPRLIDEIYDHVNTNFSLADATGYVKLLKKLNGDSLQTYTLPGEAKYIGTTSYFIYDRTKTEQLVLEKFGYPEEEAKEWRKQQAEKANAGNNED